MRRMAGVQGPDGVKGALPALLPVQSLQLQCLEMVLDILQFFVKQGQVFLKGSKRKAHGDSCPHGFGSPELWDHSKQLLALLQAISWEFTPQALREVGLFSYLTFGKTEIWNPVATQLKRS